MTCYTSIFTFFLLGEIRNLTTLSLLPLVNNCFSLSSFFQSLLSFLWIGAQFPQVKFLSYGRILTLHYYFLLMCILFSWNFFFFFLILFIFNEVPISFNFFYISNYFPFKEVWLFNFRIFRFYIFIFLVVFQIFLIFFIILLSCNFRNYSPKLWNPNSKIKEIRTRHSLFK